MRTTLRLAGAVALVAISGCAESPDLDAIGADVCTAIKASLDDIAIAGPPNVVMSDHLASLELDPDDEHEVRSSVPQRCPGAISAADTAHGAAREQMKRNAGEAREAAAAAREAAIEASSRYVAGGDASQEVLDAIATLMTHYCHHGAGDEDVSLVWLAKIAAGRGDEIPGMFYELDGYESYESRWSRDEVVAAAEALPPHPGTSDAFDLAVSGPAWGRHADGYCHVHH